MELAVVTILDFRIQSAFLYLYAPLKKHLGHHLKKVYLCPLLTVILGSVRRR